MEKECKVTARIEPELYIQIKDKLYHGQQTLFFRNIFRSLSIIIKNDKFNEVTDYLYKGKALVLPPVDGE